LLWSLLPSYDIVLCLCLAQKLRQPLRPPGPDAAKPGSDRQTRPLR
jgi:hypothetical protein